MSRPALVDPLHTRCLHISVYQHGEDRVRAHGDILDLRKAGFIPLGGDFQAAGIIHKMEVEAVVHRATRVLERVAVAQPVVAFEPAEATFGESCRDPADRLQAAVGQRVGPDFPAVLSRAFGGPRGCSHVLTLFQLMASALPRALALDDAARTAGGSSRHDGERILQRSLFVEGFDDEGGVLLVTRLADVLARSYDDMGDDPMDRLARQDEVRIVVPVSFPAMQLGRLEARERSRGANDYNDAPWSDLGSRVEALEGHALMSGFASTLFRSFGESPEDRLLLDTLLALAPGFIQVMAAMSDDRRVASGGRDGYTPIGGQENSCYMMRSESPSLQIRNSK